MKTFNDIKTFDDACKALGTTKKKFERRLLVHKTKLFLNNLMHLKFKRIDSIYDDLERLNLVAKALNGGWKPNFKEVCVPYFDANGNCLGSA